jgi:hypothetical protein
MTTPMTVAETKAAAKQIGISVKKITVFLPAGLTETGYMIICPCGFRRGPHTNSAVIRRLYGNHIRRCERRHLSHPPSDVAPLPANE